MAKKSAQGSRPRPATGLGARGWARKDDVARLAGVGRMTVSRALRQPEKVAEPTRARIEAAIHRVGYVPNLVAGSLSSQRSRIIAAIFPTIQHAVFADTIQGLSEVCARDGYHLMIADTNYSTAREDELIEAFLSRRPDGMALTGVTRSARSRKLLLNAGIPIVEMWELSDSPVDMVVGYSNYRAAYEMTATLAKRGYRRIGFLSRRTDNNERMRRREVGYQQAAADFGLPALEPQTIADGPDISPSDGAEALAALLARDPRVDAAFFTNDIYAAGALAWCRRNGVAVPDRLGVAGFHDLDIARMVSPALTSVHVPAREIGRRAGEMLLLRLSGGPRKDSALELSFRIVERESTRAH
jgi:LacI family transcriptional regulator, gluconate utilization system Gnt-I transcriptional repressor